MKFSHFIIIICTKYLNNGNRNNNDTIVVVAATVCLLIWKARHYHFQILIQIDVSELENLSEFFNLHFDKRISKVITI